MLIPIQANRGNTVMLGSLALDAYRYLSFSSFATCKFPYCIFLKRIKFLKAGQMQKWLSLVCIIAKVSAVSSSRWYTWLSGRLIVLFFFLYILWKLKNMLLCSHLRAGAPLLGFTKIVLVWMGIMGCCNKQGVVSKFHHKADENWTARLSVGKKQWSSG